MAKAARGGYDGKGTVVLETVDDLSQLIRSVESDDWLLEAWVEYERELALVVSRDVHGRVRSFPLVETHQSQVVNVAYRILGSQASAEDIAQVTGFLPRLQWTRVWKRRLTTWPPPSSPS